MPNQPMFLLPSEARPSAAEGSPAKSNILVIWGDDIGIHNLSIYNLGIMGYHTPILTVSRRKERCSQMPMLQQTILFTTRRRTRYDHEQHC